MFTDQTDDSLLTEGEKKELNRINGLTEQVRKSGNLTDSLIALLEAGPLWDGDVPSKSGRDSLIEMGLAVRVIMKGEQGYTACTYTGGQVYCNMYGGDSISESVGNRKRAIELQNGMKETVRRINK